MGLKLVEKTEQGSEKIREVGEGGTDREDRSELVKAE